MLRSVTTACFLACFWQRAGAQQNRASVERHTSLKTCQISGRRGRVASRDHYGVVLKMPPSLELGERISSDRHDTARPIPDDQHLTPPRKDNAISTNKPATPARPPAGRGASQIFSGTRGTGSTHMYLLEA